MQVVATENLNSSFLLFKQKFSSHAFVRRLTIVQKDLKVSSTLPNRLYNIRIT